MKNEFYTKHGGLSMTSAKYLSNLGQEKAKAAREKLKDPEFICVRIQRIGDQLPTPMSIGMTPEKLQEIPGLLKEISKMDSFSAYIMEVIKDKDDSMTAVRRMTIDQWITKTGQDPMAEPLEYAEWLKQQGLKEPEMTLELPEPPESEETDIRVLIKRKSIDEYQKYWELNSEASALGKYCHDTTAPLVEARAAYLKRLSKPLEKEGEGQNIVVYSYVPSVEAPVLEEVFENLQREYREVEAKLNKIRFDLKEEEAQRVLTETEAYQKDLESYRVEQKKVDLERQALKECWISYRKDILEEQRRIRAKFEGWKVSERNRISKLKIVIPEGLVETWKYLESLGKADDQKN